MAAAVVWSPEYPAGTQEEWFAIDSADHIGIFCIAGSGPIPEPALNKALAAQISEIMKKLEPLSSAQMLVGIALDAEFLGYARRGFFPFDWSDVGQPYTDLTSYYALQATPASPIKIKDLCVSTIVTAWLSSFRLPVDFRNCGRVSLENLPPNECWRLVGAPFPE